MIFFTRAALASVVSRGMLACRVSIDCADSKRGPQARQAGGDPGVVGNGALHKHAFTPFQLTHRTVGWATFFAPLTPALSLWFSSPIRCHPMGEGSANFCRAPVGGAGAAGAGRMCLA